jgi:hypothetical protein
MTNLAEGQTQVYTSGMVTPQYGVDTRAPYLNSPPKQLMDLTREFFKSGKSAGQVLAILVGMGTPQQMALAAIHAHNTLCAMQETEQKNHKHMKFTLVDLYEKVVSTINGLNEMAADESRTSYSGKQAKELLENALRMFPEMTINADIIAKFTTDELNDIKEGSNAREIWLKLIDEKVSPVLKYGIAKNIYKSSTAFDWIHPISELRTYIGEIYTNHKWSFKVNEAVSAIGNRNNPLDAKLAGELTTLLKESEGVVKAGFERVAMANPWSAELRAILNEMKTEEKGANQAKAVVQRVITPMISEGGQVVFHLHGKNWAFDGQNITEANVTDARFGQVLSALGLFRQVNESLVLFGENEKTLEINLTEGTIKLGSLDLSGKTATAVKESLIANKVFSFREAWKADRIATLVENFDMVGELDSALGLSSTEFLNVYLTMLAVEEGVWVNKVNPSMGLNEMKFHRTATAALKEAREFIGYDATSYLAKALVAEGHKTALVERQRSIINDELSFLESKREQINLAISRIGRVDELAQALSLVEGEITKKEKELQLTYVSEKKTKLDYLNSGYTEATIEVNAGSFKKGDEVMVNAEEYASLGDSDLVDVINPKTLKTELIKRGMLKVKI